MLLNTKIVRIFTSSPFLSPTNHNAFPFVFCQAHLVAAAFLLFKIYFGIKFGDC